MRSLRRGLMQWTLGALAFGSIVLVLVAYVFMLDEMNEVLDDNLREVAGAVARFHARGQLISVTPDPSRAAGPASPDQGELVTRVWARNGQPLDGDHGKPDFAFTSTPGARRVDIDGVEWRTYTVVDAASVVTVAQRAAARQEMAVEAASKLLGPLVLLALMIAGLLAFALRRGLRPLHEATAEIAQRTALALEPLDGRALPAEMLPLVEAFNGLMARLGDAFTAQQQFVADAAHELRSPVTAVRLQIGLLEQAASPEERHAAFGDVRDGIDRLQRLVEQLLQLSRSTPGERHPAMHAVDLGALARESVAEHSRLASRRHIDLGADVRQAAVVQGDPHELRVLLNNLVRNALHHSPAGSRVDVSVAIDRKMPLLRVTDNGPGIGQADRERVFDRFFRGDGEHVREGDPAGSGLGLAIVKAIAERHGAVASLNEAPGGRGLEVCVRFLSWDRSAS